VAAARRRVGMLLCVLALLGFSTLFIGAPASGTNVPGGVIGSDTKWTKAGSPYYILGSVSMDFRKTLEVGPGVEVIFEGNYSLGRGQGALYLNGSASEPVVLRPSNPGGPGRWSILEISGGHDCSITGPLWVVFSTFEPVPHLDRCTIDTAYRGLLVYPMGNGIISNLTLRQITLDAIEFGGTWSFVVSNLTIDHAGTAIALDHWGPPMTGAEPSNILLSHLAVSNFSKGATVFAGDWGPSMTNLLVHSEFRDGGSGFPVPFSGNVYANNFVNITEEFGFPSGGVGYYDDGARGNYWDRYTGVDADGDGVGDTPYGPDRFPLISPVPGAGTWSGPRVAPQVISTVPSPLAQQISPHPVLEVRFSEPMLTTQSFASVYRFADPMGAAVPNVVPTWVRPTELRITMDLTSGPPLSRETQYTLTILASATSLEGVPLGADYAVPFTTIPPPHVASLSPANGTRAVPRDSLITIRFNRPMDRAAVESAVRVDPVFPYGVMWAQANDSITLVPVGALAADVEYTVTITSAAKDADGMPLYESSMTAFRTAPSTTPPAPGGLLENAPVIVSAAVAVFVASALVAWAIFRRRRRKPEG